MSREYTITEALQELKLLTARISKITNQSNFISTKRSEDTFDVDKFNKEALASFQSINDLVDRRARIKSAIMQSNAVTTVEIAGKTYTVAEAISTKEYINDKNALLERLKFQKAQAANLVTNYNNDRQRKIDNLIERSLGREITVKGASANGDNSDIKTITEMYTKKNYIEVLDPIKVDDKIKALEEEIENFKHQVDYKLSYINAITKITV
jgi:hypothetical protein